MDASQDPPREHPIVIYEELHETDPLRSPTTSWRAWTALPALLGGLVIAAVGALLVDLPAGALGAHVTSSYTPPGLVLADTVVQDLGFVLAAIYFAHLGGREVRSWQFGLRRPGLGWKSAVARIGMLIVAFIILSGIWSLLFNPGEDKLLEKLGTNEGTALLLFSALLTCVVAPICEEFLFRGYMFTALRNWKGTLPAAVITGLVFGGVHAGSAPALDLIPLAALGFGLCLLYRYTGSLYPSIVAHSINNSIAFSSLENWGWQTPVLLAAALVSIGVAVQLCKRIGLIAPAASPDPLGNIGLGA